MRRMPLHEAHARLSRSMEEWYGWEIPSAYADVNVTSLPVIP